MRTRHMFAEYLPPPCPAFSLYSGCSLLEVLCRNSEVTPKSALLFRDSVESISTRSCMFTTDATTDVLVHFCSSLPLSEIANKRYTYHEVVTLGNCCCGIEVDMYLGNQKSSPSALCVCAFLACLRRPCGPASVSLLCLGRTRGLITRDLNRKRRPQGPATVLGTCYIAHNQVKTEIRSRMYVHHFVVKVGVFIAPRPVCPWTATSSAPPCGTAAHRKKQQFAPDKDKVSLCRQNTIFSRS